MHKIILQITYAALQHRGSYMLGYVMLCVFYFDLNQF